MTENNTSIMGQAENLINEAEQHEIFLGDGERNLIMNYAFHTQDIDKTKVLLGKLCMAEFEKEHGFVNPEIENVINKEIEAIDKFGIPEYKLHFDETTKYIILAQKDNTAFLKRIIDSPIDDPTPYIVVSGIHFKENNLIEWNSGKYCSDFDSAIVDYSYKAEGIEKPLKASADNLSSYEKFQSAIKEFKKEESWQDKLTHSDKDNDGIPDIIDETYNPPEYFYRYASREEIQKLKEKNIDFEFKPKKPSDQYLIKHLKSDCEKINSILQQGKALKR